MRLYTIQSLKVASILKKETIYFPTFEQADFLQGDGTEGFREAYTWMMQQYNLRKGHDFSSAPVWWFTDKEEAQRVFLRRTDGCILLKAEVPDKLVLLHDSDLWYLPLTGTFCGWAGHRLMASDSWCNEWDLLYDKLSGLYKKNPAAQQETWKEVFNITKNGNQNLHGVTAFIDLYWIEEHPPFEKTAGQITEM